MKLISWNVNGIRASVKKGAFDMKKLGNPDILCIQEIKATEDQIPLETKNIPGYVSFFHSPTEKKGYSGVGLYAKQVPKQVNFGMGIPELDQEGRLIEAHFENFILLNIYFPNGGGGPERLAFKMKFYDAFLKHIQKLRKTQPNIIFCGDVNTAHESIDLARPKENEKNTGFLPEERAWLDEVVNHGYIDTFRYLYPNKKDAYTYWDQKTAARERNVGWRIDYFFLSPTLVPKLKKAFILDTIFGSDHCPLGIEINL